MQATDTIIIDFLLSHILSRFGCPRRLIIDNAQAFYSSRLVKFCNEYNIVLSHSTTYYPQGNGLVESSNKSLMRTIKKLLQENKKAWNAKLVYALWANRVSTKKSIGTSPFQLVYGTNVVFPASLAMPIMKYIQEDESEPNPTQRRINQLVEIHQIREGLCDKAQKYQDKVKHVFDKRAKVDCFSLGDLVLKWDARHEDKGKHGKFDELWKGPYSICSFSGRNAYFLEDSEGKRVGIGPVNGRFLKHYLTLLFLL